MRKTTQLQSDLPAVCRLGLATRGNTHLQHDDVDYAIERGINYLNWCGKPDGMSQAIASLGGKRRDVVVAVQFQARRAEQAGRELEWLLGELKTDYLDVATLYYVESEEEWQEIVAPGGAWEVLAEHKRAGTLKMIGLTSHQRKLAARWAKSKVPRSAQGDRRASRSSLSGSAGSISSKPQGRRRTESSNPGRHHLDLLMVRYNAAHRGAEQDVFLVTQEREMPVVTFTGLRWKALLRATPEDPAGHQPPSAPECYRFCLAHPAVSVALVAPDDRSELEEDFTLLDDWHPPDENQYQEILRHGDRVHKHAGEFW